MAMVRNRHEGITFFRCRGKSSSRLGSFRTNRISSREREQSMGRCRRNTPGI